MPMLILVPGEMVQAPIRPAAKGGAELATQGQGGERNPGSGHEQESRAEQVQGSLEPWVQRVWKQKQFKTWIRGSQKLRKGNQE